MNALVQPRIVSLIASATEIVHALGAGDEQVARSHECDWPPSVKALPAITRPKFKVEGSSAEVDKAVRALVERGLSVYDVDAEALRALEPDVIITQDQCEVCAVSLADVERAVCTFVGGRPRVVSLRPHTLSDVETDIGRVAEAIGREAQGKALVATIQRRLADICIAVAGRPRPRVAFIEWIDPPMSCGHWMPELIDIAGGTSVFGATGEPSPWITWKELAAADPDVVIVAPCGYDIPTTLQEMKPLARHELWQNLRALREGRVYVADGNAYFNRPGPRLVDSAEIVAEILHPEVCDFGLRNGAYVIYEGEHTPQWKAKAHR
jgi:iron complex transport system substrate-binding protein